MNEYHLVWLIFFESLHVYIHNDKIKIIDNLSNNDFSTIENIIFKEEQDEVKNLLNVELDDIERKILKMTFGIECNELKQKEISDIIGLPQYKISRIKNKALKHLKSIIIKNNELLKMIIKNVSIISYKWYNDIVSSGRYLLIFLL